jgi:hypothetical protein
MTQHAEMTDRRVGRLSQSKASALNPGRQPIFFFDGDFRTRVPVQRRAQFNRLMAGHMSR